MAADCQARCVDGADLGSPVPGTDHMIAHADPRCPVHGDPDAVARYIAALERVAQAAHEAVRQTERSRHSGAVIRLGAALAELDKED